MAILKPIRFNQSSNANDVPDSAQNNPSQVETYGLDFLDPEMLKQYEDQYDLFVQIDSQSHECREEREQVQTAKNQLEEIKKQDEERREQQAISEAPREEDVSQDIQIRNLDELGIDTEDLIVQLDQQEATLREINEQQMNADALSDLQETNHGLHRLKEITGTHLAQKAKWEKTRDFQFKTNLLNQNKVYWEYLTYYMLIKKMNLDSEIQEKHLKEQSRIIKEMEEWLAVNTPRGFLNGVQVFFGVQSANENVKRHQEVENELAIIAKMYNSQLELHQKEKKKLALYNRQFKRAEQPFLALFVKAASVDTPIPSSFELDVETKRALNKYSKLPAVKHRLKTFKETKKEWEVRGKFSFYSNSALNAYHVNYLNPLQDYIDSAKEELRSKTKPRGFFERIKYFFTRVLPGTTIPKEKVVQLKEVIRDKEIELVAEKQKVFDAMLSRMQAACQRGNLAYDDIALDHYHRLAAINASPINVNPTYNVPNVITTENTDEEQVPRLVEINARYDLSREHIHNYLAYMESFINRYKNHREYRTYAKDLRDRIAKLPMFLLPDGLRRKDFKTDAVRAVINNPTIWLAFNTLENKFSQHHVGELYLLDNIDENGEITWFNESIKLLKSATVAFDAARPALERYAKSDRKTAILLNALNKKFKNINDDYQRKRQELARQARDMASKELVELIVKGNAETVTATERENVIKHIRAANILINKTGLSAQFSFTALPTIIENIRKGYVTTQQGAINTKILFNELISGDSEVGAKNAVLADLMGMIIDNEFPKSAEGYQDFEINIKKYLIFNLEESAKDFLAEIAQKYVLPKLMVTNVHNLMHNFGVVESQANFIKRYLPDALEQYRRTLTDKIQSFSGSNNDLAVKLWLFGEYQDIQSYCIKRLDYLLEHYTNRNCVLNEIDQWFFGVVAEKYPSTGLLIREKLFAVIDKVAKYEDGGITSIANLVKLTASFGKVDLLKAMHEKIITSIHNHAQLGEIGKNLAIDDYLHALDANLNNGYNFVDSEKEEFQLFAFTCIDQLCASRFSQDNQHLYQALFSKKLASEKTYQNYNTKYTIEKINSSFEAYITPARTYGLEYVESLFGVEGVERIMTAIHDRVDDPRFGGKYFRIGKGVIQFANDLLNVESIRTKYDADKKLKKKFKELVHQTHIEFVAVELNNFIEQKFKNDNIKGVISLYNFVHSRQYQQVFSLFNSQDLINIGLNNTEDKSKLIAKLEKSDTLQKILMGNFEKLFADEFDQRLKFIFNVENVIKLGKGDWDKGLEVAKECAEDTLNQFLNGVKNEDFKNRLRGQINQLPKQNGDLYINLTKSLAANTELENSQHRHLYGRYITLENIHTLREFMTRVDLVTLATSLEDKIRRLENVRTVMGITKDNQIIENYNNEQYANPASYALRVFYNMLFEDPVKNQQSSEVRQRDIQILNDFQVFNTVVTQVETILENRDVSKEDNFPLDMQSVADVAKANEIYSNPQFWQKYIDSLIEKRVGYQVKVLVEQFGTQEQKDVHAKIVAANKNISQLTELIRHYKPGLNIKAQLDELAMSFTADINLASPSFKKAFEEAFQSMLDITKFANITLLNQFNWHFIPYLGDGIYSGRFNEFISNTLSASINSINDQLDPFHGRRTNPDDSFIDEKAVSLVANYCSFINSFGKPSDIQMVHTKLDRLLMRMISRNVNTAKADYNYPGTTYIKKILDVAYTTLGANVSNKQVYDIYTRMNRVLDKVLTFNRTATEENSKKNLDSLIKIKSSKDHQLSFVKDFERVEKFHKVMAHYDVKMKRFFETMASQQKISIDDQMILLELRDKLVRGIKAGIIKLETILSTNFSSEDIEKLNMTPREQSLMDVSLLSGNSIFSHSVDKTYKNELRAAIFVSAAMHVGYTRVRDIDARESAYNAEFKLLHDVIRSCEQKCVDKTSSFYLDVLGASIETNVESTVEMEMNSVKAEGRFQSLLSTSTV